MNMMNYTNETYQAKDNNLKQVDDNIGNLLEVRD